MLPRVFLNPLILLASSEMICEEQLSTAGYDDDVRTSPAPELAMVLHRAHLSEPGDHVFYQSLPFAL